MEAFSENSSKLSKIRNGFNLDNSIQPAEAKDILKKICFVSRPDNSTEKFVHFQNPNNQSFSLKKVKATKIIWTKEEDKILENLVEEYQGRCWKKVSSSIPGKTPIQCLHRWNKMLKPGIIKGPWTLEEDRMLINYVSFYGAHNFSECSKFIIGRNNKQCRERWFNVLNPKVVKGEWKLEEDYLIFKLYSVYGGKWIRFTPLFKGLRAENSVKNRFYSTIRRFNTSLKYNFRNYLVFEDKVAKIFEHLKRQIKEKFQICSEDELIKFEKNHLGYQGSLPEAPLEERYNFIKSSLTAHDHNTKSKVNNDNIPMNYNYSSLAKCQQSEESAFGTEDNYQVKVLTEPVISKQSFTSKCPERSNAKCPIKTNSNKVESQTKSSKSTDCCNLKELEVNINRFCQSSNEKKIKSSIIRKEYPKPIQCPDKHGIKQQHTKDIADLSTVANEINEPCKDSLKNLMRQLDDLETLVTNTKKQIQENFCGNEEVMNNDEKPSSCIFSSCEDIVNFSNLYSRPTQTSFASGEFQHDEVFPSNN